MARVKCETEMRIFVRIGETTSSPNIRRTGTAIGTVTTTIFSTVIASSSSTDSGGGLISASIRGGRIGITHTIITVTITIRISTATIRAITTPAYTKTKSLTAKTATEMLTLTQRLLPRSSNSREKVI